MSDSSSKQHGTKQDSAVFEPIAIVGSACVLPGALNPKELWELVVEGRDILGPVPAGRWGIDPEDVLASGASADDRAWTDRGGYVDGFEQCFDPNGFAIEPAKLAALDPLFKWVLHTAREALRDAGHEASDKRVGSVFGNLSFPSASMSRYAESVWRNDTLAKPDAQNRFTSGLPALLLEQALELEAGAFALDAACASSLYAIKYACDALHDGKADVMLAGAVNCADDLFIHVGFSALSALSKSGRSRPFNRGADGLIPAEGAAFVALRRLEDARCDGDNILGVIRGVGLSNDGRGQGALVPAKEGQVRAISAAYAMSGVSPQDISLLECHATGTSIGDTTEIESLCDVFGECVEPLGIGSLKSNMGHLITAAGVAGLIKVLEGMRTNVRPPTLHAQEPIAALDGSPFRIIDKPEPWQVPDQVADGIRRAGISAFGFGGNNAHLIVEQYADVATDAVSNASAPRVIQAQEPVAIVGVGVVAAECSDRAAFSEAWLSGARCVKPGADGNLEGRIDAFDVNIAGLGIPPNDLQQTLPQQLLMLDAGGQAAAEVATLPRERTGVYVGMGTDPEVARYGARWRLANEARLSEGDALAQARDGVVSVLKSAGVIGSMPNIVANRLNRYLDIAGPSCTVSLEERSGLEALRIACRALRAHELDAALVGAVDMSCEPVHVAALQECQSLPSANLSTNPPGDASVALVLKRLDDAQRDGDKVYAVIGDQAEEAGANSLQIGLQNGESSLEQRFGHAHAASGLLHVTAAALALHHRQQPDGTPWLSSGIRTTRTAVSAMGGDESIWTLTEHADSRAKPERAKTTTQTQSPAFWAYEGHTGDDVLSALDAGKTTELANLSRGARLVIVADDETVLQRRVERARAHIRHGAPAGEGVHYRAAPVTGELAFVFTSAGSAYHGMGRELVTRLPELGDRLGERFDGLADAMSWVFAETAHPATNDQRLWGASCLSQMHVELSRGLLGIQPDAAIGYSSGESNSLFALGAWTDMDAMRKEIDDSALYTTELAGPFHAVARTWAEDAGTSVEPAGIRWSSWAMLAPVARIRELIAQQQHLHLAIIHTDNDCVIAGETDACQRVVEHVIAEFGSGRCFELEYNMAAHVPEVNAFRDEWLRIHRRKVTPVPGVRFYSGGSEASYTPETEACTQTIMTQAQQTLDFSGVIERSWADGVRIFVEHGPMSACSGWIREVLGERAKEAVVVSLDRQGRGIETVFEAIAALVAAGVSVDLSMFLERLSPAVRDQSREQDNRPAQNLRLPGHPAPVHLAPVTQIVTQSVTQLESGIQSMQPAPSLPSIMDEDWVQASSVQLDTVAPLVSNPVTVTPPSVESTPGHAADPGVDTAVDPAVGLWQHQIQQLSQIHQQFVRQQAEVHQHFLALGLNRQPAIEPTYTGVGVAPLATQTLAPAIPTAIPTAIATPVMSQPLASESMASQPVASQSTVPQSAALPAAQPASPPTIKPIVASPTNRHNPVGPTLSRAQLEIHASGAISEIYGPLFAQQDGYERQVRMPEPPLLLADRVTGIDATPGEQSTGIMWTETDVLADSWYLNRGRMPAGIMIESGQADLMLISYMGADFLNRSDRVYRLLGCELTYEGDLPKPGETLCYEIHVDGHARQDDIRLFFFHYECLIDGAPRISVKGGQAGFFSDEELENSEGILWSPETFEPVANPRLDAPAVRCAASNFTREQVVAFSEGRAWECFGEGFEQGHTHTESPAIQTGKMLFLDEVTAFDPQGGPWGRGYLRSEAPVRPDDWYFAGHFKNDPCMPGTLMFEGCLQAMSFYLAALGFTLDRDAWRFQPVVGEPIQMQCRGQVTPQSKHIIYEVFIEEVIDGPIPTLYADLLCTVDGRKAFHARRAGLTLTPDWPLSTRQGLLESVVETKSVASVETPDGERFEFDQKSMLACAWGKPSDAFGPMYARFDGPGRVPRLPGPPYLFVSRATKVSGQIGGMETGSTVEIEYDIPQDAWYLNENGSRTAPYAVILEAALQPCGWLASYIGSALTVDEEVCFRNLDGTATLEAEFFEDAGTLRTAVTLTNISQSAGMIIVGFDVECFLSNESRESRVYVMNTVFGFFPPEALSLDNQIGQPTTDEQRAQLTEPGNFDLDLAGEPARYFAGNLSLANTRLRTIDRVTGFWPEGGTHGLGRVRAERSIDASDWYFKAHFFQDPVQPGSLGIEAMIQTLQFFMLESGMGEGIADARFEAIALNRPMTWKYRGQVVPLNNKVQVTLDVTETGSDAEGVFAIASASLWCDGIRIYSADGMGMRIVSGNPPANGDRASSNKTVGRSTAIASSGAKAQAPSTAPRGALLLDPTVDLWLADHCPTWNRPALPMMSIADLLATAVSQQSTEAQVTALRDVQVNGWVDFDGPRHLWNQVEERSPGQYFVRLFADGGDPDNPAASIEVASARVETRATGIAPPAPQALAAEAGQVIADPYKAGKLFHGSAFQLMTHCEVTGHGASLILNASAIAPTTVPVGLLHPALFDAALHGIPHDQLHQWAPEISADKVAYPARIIELCVYGAVPDHGDVRCEVRFDGFLAKPDLPRFRVQLISDEGVFAQFLLVEACLPKGPLGSAAPKDRRRFLRDREYVEGVALSRQHGGETRLSEAEVLASDWMPGTIVGIYGSSSVEAIATKEHLAKRHRLHPGKLPEALPLSRPGIQVVAEGEDIVIRDEVGFNASNQLLALEKMHQFWNPLVGVDSQWIGQDLWDGLLQRYVGRVLLEDPESFESLKGRGAIFVGNHQVQIESLLITHMLSALMDTQVVTLANAKHEQRWIGWLLQTLASYPGSKDPQSILYFDQSRPDTMFELLKQLKPEVANGTRVLFLHPQGTRSQSCTEPVTKISSIFLDLAIELDVPIVPVRISGGLPVKPILGKLEFTSGHTRQDYTIGAPISAQELGGLGYKERGQRVLAALNSLGATRNCEEPNPTDAQFSASVAAWQKQTGASEIESTFLRVLQEAPVKGKETQWLIDGIESGSAQLGTDPKSMWLGSLATQLYGPKGPRIEAG